MARSPSVRLDCGCTGVVLPAIQRTFSFSFIAYTSQVMALAASLAVLFSTGLFACVAALSGFKLLRLLAVKFDSDPEHLLCSIAVGVICLEVLLFFVQFSSHIRFGVIAAIGLALLLGISELSQFATRASRIVRRCLNASTSERMLIGVTVFALLLEGLAAMAPVTGSDALHYHFTTPSLILQFGFHPDFFLSHSFFTGQTHLLILAGLALGSSQLAMGFLFLGGVLAAAAAACLAREWADGLWAWTTALVFVLTPVVFWQISTSGAPDLWMAFFATVGVLVISKASATPHHARAIIAGALAGAVAGTKYTGCFIAASMAVAFIWEARSIARSLLFFMASIAAGVYPYARNLVWTGDPVFPFLLPLLSPGKVNSYALFFYRADTGAGEHKTFSQLLEFPFFAGIDPLHLGFWQFLGPLVLAFAPFLLFVVRKTSAWRTAFIVWVMSAFLIGASSGMTRFLLPVFPIALAAVLAGASSLGRARWRVARSLAIVSLSGFLLFGAAGLVLYARSPLLAAVGRISPDTYLRQQVQEYEKVEFINQILGGRENQGKTLVFVRHLYYLHASFIYADPTASWSIDPSKFQTPEQWLALFREQDIRWVVRSGSYPPVIAAPLTELEASGKLVPAAQTDVTDLKGIRISRERVILPIAILKVVE